MQVNHCATSKFTYAHAEPGRVAPATCLPQLTRASLSQVYDLPDHLTLPEATTAQCRWSAYNSELQLHRLLTDPASLVRPELVTADPAEADVFFVPMFASCYSFNCWVKAGWKKTERCNVDGGYIQPTMEWIKAQPWWGRRGGADHVLPHPMDFGDGYYTEGSRLAMNDSMYLVTVGDHRPKPYSAHYRHHRDILIPSATHLLNSYYLNPLDYVDELGHPRPTPIGAADPDRKSPLDPTHAEIWAPSPSLTPSWRKKLGAALAGSPVAVAAALQPRQPTTAIFRGGVGQAGEGEAYALSIRSLFFPSAGNASAAPFSPHVHPGFASLPGFDIAEWSENDPYARALARSRFGLVPPGYTLDTTRLYEYLAFGVVPVFVGTGPHHGQALPFGHDFDYDAFTISIPRSQAHRVPQILAAVPEEEYEQLRREVWAVGRLLVLEGRKGDVWRWIARDLCRLRRIGTGAGPEISNN